MLISLLIYIIFSNAIPIRRDKSILHSRIVIRGLIITIILSYNNLYIKTVQQSLSSDNYSPIQLINQIRGYYYVNPFIVVSLAITLFSFLGIPPIIGFFAKHMILSAAIDSGYIFMALVAIITSVIGAGYYLNVIKQIFFYKNEYINNPNLENTSIKVHTNANKLETITIKPHDIMINSSLSTSISTLTLLLLLFIYTPEEWFSTVNVLTLLKYNEITFKITYFFIYGSISFAHEVIFVIFWNVVPIPISSINTNRRVFAIYVDI